MILLIVFFSSPVYATTWHVPADFDSLSTAMDVAQDGDTILIEAGTYPGPFSLVKDLTLVGDIYEPGAVVLEVTSFVIGAPTMARLEGLTFSGENTPGSCLVTGTARISDCHFENFQMEDTWGITFFFSDVEFRRCLVRDNNNYASMFWVTNSGDVAFFECEFMNNSGAMGSAITCGGSGFLLIKDCFFSQNHATGRGGAVYASQFIEIENSRFEGNIAGSFGGAIFCEDIHILNCSFTNNSAANGGAVGVDQAAHIGIENTDFSNNTASVAGPQGFTTSVGFVDMVCCLADLDLWEGQGEVTLDNDGCTVGTHQISLEAVKAMFR